VSVIVPTLEEDTRIEGTLRDLLAQDPAPREVIVVDGGSKDGTASRAAACQGARVLDSKAGRGRQLDLGARSARGSVLLFLHADTRLPSGALRRVEETAASVVGGRFRVRFPHRHPVLRLSEACSRFPFPFTSFGDSAFFVRRDVYLRMGGFEPIPLFEDVRFFRRLRREGPVCVLPEAVTTDCRRFCEEGPWRRLGENALLFLAHRAGVSPARLHAHYSRVRSRGSRGGE
jgi:rSAM/selenodomain-associated transferase 2